MAQRGRVYFVCYKGDEKKPIDEPIRVKIGWVKSDTPKAFASRLASIQTGNEKKVIELFSHRTIRFKHYEKILKLAFDPYRIQHEWFKLTRRQVVVAVKFFIDLKRRGPPTPLYNPEARKCDPAIERSGPPPAKKKAWLEEKNKEAMLELQSELLNV